MQKKITKKPAPKKTAKPAKAARRKQGSPLKQGTFSVKTKTKSSRMLAAFRKAGGDLDKLAKSINVNPWTVYRWARGLNEPRAMALQALKLAIDAFLTSAVVPAGAVVPAAHHNGRKVSATAILDYIVSTGQTGATDDEIEAALGASHQTASARRRDLVVRGMVVDSGQTRQTRSGRPASVWHAVRIFTP